MSEIAKTGQSRVFIIEGRARPDHAPVYESCIRMTGVSQGFGDVESIQCPDPDNYDSFVEVGSVRGAKERGKTKLEGRLAIDVISAMLRIARKGCALDLQLHMGSCTDPKSSNTFTKAVILEDAVLVNYSTEDLGALQSSDNKAINESADVSAKDIYEVVPLSFAARADNIVTNEVIDVTICDSVSCGSCTTESDGCKKIFAITKAAGGSPGTPPDILISTNGGATFYAHDIDSLSSAQDPDGIDCLAGYAVVISAALNNLNICPLSSLDGVTDPTWTSVTTGFVAGGTPKAIWSAGSYAFIVGSLGYIYGCEDPAAGVTVLDAGAATVDTLLAVHGLSSSFAVAVGNNGAVVVTHDGSIWTPATAKPVGVGINLNTVWVVSKDEWIVGSSTGRLYYTLNGGVTWTALAFPGSGSGAVKDIWFSTKSVGFMAHQTSATKGRILRTFDGGHSWVVSPERSGQMPANDRINRLAGCVSNPNFIVGVGLADDAADGFVVVGEGS